jgi:hypothetical protein
VMREMQIVAAAVETQREWLEEEREKKNDMNGQSIMCQVCVGKMCHNNIFFSINANEHIYWLTLM